MHDHRRLERKNRIFRSSGPKPWPSDVRGRQ